jgi:hypothetical protein
MPIVRRRMSLALLALASLGAGAEARAQAQTAITSTSRPVRLLRGWEETVKTPDGREVPRRVEVLFDYDRGVGFENVSTLEGALIGRRLLGPGHPAPSREEIEEAYDVVRADAEFAKIFKRFRVVFEGGFILTEERGRPCGPGSRCLRVFLLSSDRAGTIRQVVVDLVRQRVAYDDFAPDSRRKGQ